MLDELTETIAQLCESKGVRAEVVSAEIRMGDIIIKVEEHKQ